MPNSKKALLFMIHCTIACIVHALSFGRSLMFLIYDSYIKSKVENWVQLHLFLLCWIKLMNVVYLSSYHIYHQLSPQHIIHDRLFYVFFGSHEIYVLRSGSPMSQPTIMSSKRVVSKAIE